MELEGAYKAIKSNPLLKAGIQIKADLLGDYLSFSRMPHQLLSSLVPLLYCSNSQEVFPDFQPKSGFPYLEPMVVCPALWDDREQILPLLWRTAFQVFEKGCHI